MSRRKASTAPANPEVLGVAITNPGRVVFPGARLTKLDIAHYYEAMAEHMLRYVSGRPLSVVRCPAGQGGECFFQKHGGGTFPDHVLSRPIREKKGSARYLSIDSEAELVTLVQYGVLEIHPWASTVADTDHAQYMIFDLDPGPGVTFDAVKRAALDVRRELENVELRSYLKTTGGKGLHVVVPLKPAVEWNVVHEFAHTLAIHLERTKPETYVSTMAKSLRKGRIFVDYLRNTRGATSVAPFSVRAREGAPVSMPVSWEQLSRLKSGADFTVANAAAVVAKRRSDPWADFFRYSQRLVGVTATPAGRSRAAPRR